MQIQAGPVADGERIEAIDTLRGVAALGILLMNVTLFAMPYAAYYNPYATGTASRRDLAVWAVMTLLADLKFMTIFSMLFGAGIVLITTRAEQRGESPARLHYRRMAWLLVFGLIHGFVLWHGDILVLYAICGALVYPARRLAPRTLLLLGVAMLLIGSVIAVGTGIALTRSSAEVVAEFQQWWSPSPQQVAAETTAFRGGWLAQESWRLDYSLEGDTSDVLSWGLWRAGGLMLVGMALLKWDVLTGHRPRGFSQRLAALGLLASLPLIAWGVYVQHTPQPVITGGKFFSSQWNYWGSIPLALAYVALVVLLHQSGRAAALVARLAAVGRMAFSSYIFETLACTLIFYGTGLGLYGRVDRLQQLGIAIAIWIVILAAAPAWLARYRYGPLEWVWRSLTYGRAQPLRRQPPTVDIVAS